MEIRQLDRDLWVIDHPLQLMGIQVGTRTAIVRLASGGLFVHSPGPLGGDLARQIEALGAVVAIVAPNRVHWFYVGENARAFPKAAVHLAPGLARKRPELAPAHELGDRAPELWAADLDQVWVRGSAILEEVVFFHRASRTLLLTDLAFNFHDAPGWWTRLFLRVNGAWRRFGPTRMARTTMRDRAALRASLDRVLAWDFDRITVTHGDVLERGGREALRSAYAWLE